MLRFLFLAALLQCTISQQYQQKVAPGVPPQNYQNYQQPPPPPPQQQQYQQQQQQYQQPPPPPPQQQYQAPPPQQQQQQFQQQQQQTPQQQFQQPQQQPQQQQQHGHAHQGDPQLLNPANINQERERKLKSGQTKRESNTTLGVSHIQEHMEVPIDTSKMSEQELQFHYFKMHDADNNNKLDGCELIKSLIHWHEQGHKQAPQAGTPPVGEKIFGDDELVNLIDPILNMDDHNRDGYIDYPEFVRAQQKSQQKEGGGN